MLYNCYQQTKKNGLELTAIIDHVLEILSLSPP